MIVALARRVLGRDFSTRNEPTPSRCADTQPKSNEHKTINAHLDLTSSPTVPPQLLEEVIAERSSQATPLLKGSSDSELSKFPAIQRAIRQESKLRLQPGNRSVFKETQRNFAKGLILGLHGWSAGTWQFEHLANQFSRRGYHVYLPRLPGHGFTDNDGTPTSKEFPINNQMHIYTEFANRIYREAASLNLPIHVVGLSGGGTIALDIAGRHHVETAVLFDPFLSPGESNADHLMTVFKWCDRLTLGQSSLLLRLLPVVFETPKLNVERWGRNGHVDFNAAQLYTLTHYGRKAIEESETLATPIQVVTSNHAPTTVSRKCLKKLVNSGEKRALYAFAKESEVPHAMLHWREFDNDVARAQARALTFNLIENQQPIGNESSRVD